MTAFESLLQEFRQAISDCRRIYMDAGRDCGISHPHLLDCHPHDFLVRMKDLHTGLLVKVFASITGGHVPSGTCEERFAQTLFLHLWNRRLNSAELQKAMPLVFSRARSLQWSNVLAPFVRLAPLAERRGQLATVIMRVANLTAKSDGVISADEQHALREMEERVWAALNQIRDHSSRGEATTASLNSQAEQLRGGPNIGVRVEAVSEDESPVDHAQALELALQELDQLVGLESVKREVRTLTNYLRLQQHRRSMGLPETPLSVHMVFAGNPGTGKTTVARIIGRILGALQILEKGHLVETDRSGLVAEFAGQTGPKTHRRVDEALDGVLFIDEAYSLAGGDSEDPYGKDAIQTLLKRMEDDRQRLAVILAGYPQEMEAMLRSNPGLSSRFNTRLTFEDYGPVELAAIFENMCKSNHYRMRWKTRMKLLRGLEWLHRQRDEHFGNGREVRNLFERAVRRLADRVAEVTPITRETLTRLQPSDLHFPQAPEDALAHYDDPQAQLSVACPKCQASARILAKHLGKRFPCRNCGKPFIAKWGAISS